MQRNADPFLEWQWPSLGIVGPLDVALSLLLLAVLPTLMLLQIKVVVPKTRLTEALTLASDRRGKLVEEFALSGEPIGLAPATPATLPRTAQAHPGGLHPSANKRKASVRVEGASIIVGFDIGDDELALYPAVQDGRVPQVVVWQCGRNRLGAGWLVATPQLRQQVPEALLPTECRQPGAPL